MMLSFCITETPLALLVVGLGGGSLPLFVHDHFPKSRIEAVEIDPCMLEVATQWFGFSQSDRMKVHIADGLDYVTSLAEGEGTAIREFGGVKGRWIRGCQASKVSSIHLLRGRHQRHPSFTCTFADIFFQ